MKNETSVTIRIPANLLTRAESLVGPLDKAAGYLLGSVKRSAVLRLAIARGLAQLEGEMESAGQVDEDTGDPELAK